MSRIDGVIMVVFLLSVKFALAQSIALPDLALQDLKSDNLSRANLSIYEEQAVLKWQDVLDYLAIVGSQKYNLELRETALEAILSNFDKNAKLPCTWLIEPKEKAAKNKQELCRAQDVFQELLKRPSYELELRIEGIKVQQNLHKISKDTYQGELVYQQQVKTKKNKNIETFKEGKEEQIRIQFLLKRMDKQFGTTTEVVWEIKFLGVL